MLQAMATCAEPMYVERLAIVWMMRLNRSLSVACLTDRWLADFSPANGVVELLSRLDGGRPCSLPRVLQNDLWMRLPPRLTKLNAALSVCSIPCPAYVSGSLPICIMPYSPIGIATFLASSAACMKIFFRLRLPALATNHRRALLCGPVRPPGRGVPRLPRRLLLPQSVGQASPPQGVLTVGPRPGALRRRAIYGFLRPRRPLPRPCRCPRCRLIRVVGRLVGSLPAGSTRDRGPRRTPRAITTSLKWPGIASARCGHIRDSSGVSHAGRYFQRSTRDLEGSEFWPRDEHGLCRVRCRALGSRAASQLQDDLG